MTECDEHKCRQIGHFHDGGIHDNCQSPSVCCFLLKIRDIVIKTSLGLPNLHTKEKTRRILVVVFRERNRGNRLLHWHFNIQLFQLTLWDQSIKL